MLVVKLARTYLQLMQFLAFLGLLIPLVTQPAAAQAFKLVVLGDSLTAGYGLQVEESFPAKLEAALRSRGMEIVVENAGVSGDTARQGLERLDWSVGQDADAVIVELGANDALRGLDPYETRRSLDEIIGRLKQRNLPVMLAGMLAPPNAGSAYKELFDSIYPALAQKHEIDLYPFFLDGVAADPALNLDDGMHPNARGVDEIVRRMLPKIEAFVTAARQKKARKEP